MPHKEVILSIFGLHNSGSICFFNTAIQALLSCKSLNAAILDAANGSDDTAINLIAQLIYKYKVPKSINAPELKPIDDITSMLCTLFTYGGQQEDAHDTIMYLLDMLGHTAAKLFTIRYKSEICCRACNTKTDARFNDELFIDIPEVVAGTTINNLTDMMSYIRQNYQNPPDYKCEKCQIRGQCVQINSLSRLPRTIMILFKKYTSKNVRYFPPELIFGRHKFAVVAQVEHSGGTGGGHYYLKAIRQKKINPLIKTNTNNLFIDKVFLIDDEHTSVNSDGFVPTRETYLVFYELI